MVLACRKNLKIQSPKATQAKNPKAATFKETDKLQMPLFFFAVQLGTLQHFQHIHYLKCEHVDLECEHVVSMDFHGFSMDLR